MGIALAAPLLAAQGVAPDGGGGFGAGGQRATTPDAPLQFGVLPNVSTRILLAQYQPFRLFLEQELPGAVEVVTAPGLRAFHDRTMAGAYDLTVTAANLGRVAQLDAGLQPVAMYEPRIPGLLVTHRDRPLADIRQARGSRVAMANPLSLVAITFHQWVRGAGLEFGRDLDVAEARNEDSLALMLTSGEARLAVMSAGEFAALRADLRETLVVARAFARVPGFLLLLGPRVAAPLATRIGDCLALFPGTDAGRSFLAGAGFTGLRRVAQDDLAALDPLLPETRRLLAAS